MQIISLFVAALLSCGSCSRRLNEPDARPVVFDVAVAANTRASSDLSHPEDVDIAVRGYSLPGEASWAMDRDDAVLEMEGVRAVHAGGSIWKPENGQTWPERGRTMTVFAYSPYGRGEFGEDGSVIFRNYSLSEGLDPLYCEAADRHYNSLGRINLPFSRALCLVGFEAVSSLDLGMELQVKKLTLTGIRCSGDFSSLPEPSWEASGEPCDLVVYEGGAVLSEGRETLGSGVYLIPQSGSIGVELVAGLSDGTSLRQELTLSAEAGIDWIPGKLYTYTLKITHDLQLVVEKASIHV